MRELQLLTKMPVNWMLESVSPTGNIETETVTNEFVSIRFKDRRRKRGLNLQINPVFDEEITEDGLKGYRVYVLATEEEKESYTFGPLTNVSLRDTYSDDREEIYVISSPELYSLPEAIEVSIDVMNVFNEQAY